MSRDTDGIVLVLVLDADPDRGDEYAAWLDAYGVRVAESVESGLDALDDEVDVVLLDAGLIDADPASTVGRIRARHADCQIGLLSGDSGGIAVLGLDVDEYVPRPIAREELRETVARLVDHGAVEGALDRYLSLVERRRRVEARRDPEELDDDERYRELTGEIAARRSQIDTLLERTTGGTDGADAATADDADTRPAAAVEHSNVAEPPLYRSRPGAFYALWFVAALAYGAGDVVSTLYATVAVPGLIEGNPVVGGLLATVGIPGFLALKLLVFLVLISVSVQGGRVRDRYSYYWPPVVATGLGLLLTGWNLRLILGL
ncbi:HalX domain-containing protein [Halorubrum sp. BV1]|uniref:HalX domain-containing protein n=1 Tax=Halorubrum sp. BV1 TaxID=1498500 RepID=UPI0018AD262D|nr:HalX domain-containing protein [Halorubrum sp. BV1]